LNLSTDNTGDAERHHNCLPSRGNHAIAGEFFLQFLLFGYAFATVISIGSVLQEEITYKRYNDWQDVARLVSYCFLEHFPYRQMHMIWRLQGLWQYLRGDVAWKPLKRKGLESAVDG
jgi:hypothetical protein